MCRDDSGGGGGGGGGTQMNNHEQLSRAAVGDLKWRSNQLRDERVGGGAGWLFADGDWDRV